MLFFLINLSVVEGNEQVLTVHTASCTAGVIFILCCNIIDCYTQTVVSNIKINDVIYILNSLKLTACIEVEYDVEVYPVISDVLQR
jgi:hypothetical protein